MLERRAVHRTIVVLDVERFGDPRRTDPHQLAVREGLYRSVGEAFQQAELPWTPDTHEDRGDGILVVLPSEVHKSLLVEFEEELVRERESDLILRQLNDLRDGGLLTVVLTLREDSFGALFVSQEAFGERLRRNAVPLRGMDRYELAEAIRLPAEWHGIDVTDPLVEELVEAIRDNPGALPLLEFSLDQMWRALPPAKGPCRPTSIAGSMA